MDFDPSLSKAELRRSLLQVRQALPVELWRDRSDQICCHLQATPLFQQAQTILAYFSIRQEPDLSRLFAIDKTWGFPRCVARSLHWHHWSPQSQIPLQPGAFGILEPPVTCPQIAVAQVDLILVPAIACDHQGYRLGYGGGFYDRLLRDSTWATKPTIGILFDSALCPNLPHDTWDLPLTALCSESGFWLVQP